MNTCKQVINKKEGIKMKKKLEEYTKALYVIDMNNGFVNFGAMANPEYNKLVPEQKRLIEKFRREGELVDFVLEAHDPNAVEFDKFPVHCVKGSDEAKLIPQYIKEPKKPNTKVYYKNSINGMLSGNIQRDLKKLKKLKELVFCGVCLDYCVLDFGYTGSRYLDEINKRVKMFLVKNCCDTFDSPEHNKQEWTEITYKMLEHAGITLVENFEELEEYERELVLK